MSARPRVVPDGPGVLFEALRVAARAATSAGELPVFLAELERVRTEALLTVLATSPVQPVATPARVLTVEEGASRIGRTRWWIYRNKATLPFIVRFGTGGYGISEAALERWIGKRTSDA